MGHLPLLSQVYYQDLDQKQNSWVSNWHSCVMLPSRAMALPVNAITSAPEVAFKT